MYYIYLQSIYNYLYLYLISHILIELFITYKCIYFYSIYIYINSIIRCCLVAKSLSDSLQPHGLQHTRLRCPSVSPGACSNSCLLSRWCHPTISPSVTSFSSRPQYFPSSRYFPMSWLFTSGGQSTAASASVLPMNIQG